MPNCELGWPQTRNNPSASAFQLQGLQVCKRDCLCGQSLFHPQTKVTAKLTFLHTEINVFKCSKASSSFDSTHGQRKISLQHLIPTQANCPCPPTAPGIFLVSYNCKADVVAQIKALPDLGALFSGSGSGFCIILVDASEPLSLSSFVLSWTST